MCVFLLYRNISDMLSCFSDSPPPSPTFPEGGNPVLYGEEDNKVTRTDFWYSQAGHWSVRLCTLEWNMHLPCHPECPGWAYPYPECGHQDWQRHWWRWPGSQLPRVHSVKGGTNKAFFVSPRYQQRELNVWDCSEKTSWHLFPFSHYRNLCCLNMASVGWLSLWLRR